MTDRPVFWRHVTKFDNLRYKKLAQTLRNALSMLTVVTLSYQSDIMAKIGDVALFVLHRDSTPYNSHVT